MKRRGHLYDVVNRPTRDEPIPLIPSAAQRYAAVIAVRRNKLEHNERTPPMNHDNLMPLALVSIETGHPVDVLVARFRHAVQINDAGLRCVEAERSRVYIAAHRAAQQAQREQAAARQAEHQTRIAEIARRNRAQRIGGRPAVSGNSCADLAGDQRYADVTGDWR